MNKVFYIVSLLIVIACGEPTIDIPDYSPKLAVDGYIEVGKPPLMYLTYSSAFISDYDSIDFVNMVKLNVAAYIITEEGDTLGFTRRTNTDEFPPFKYTTTYSELTGEAGKSYQILIRKTGYEDIVATTSIPTNAPEVLDINFIMVNESDSTGYYELEMLNSADPEYYFIQNKIWGEESFYPVQFPARSNRLTNADTIVFTLYKKRNSNLWNPESLSDTLQSNSSESTGRGYYNYSDTVIFCISTLDSKSYDVLASIFLDTEFPDSPFKGLTQLPESNVSNGIGRWTGMNSVKIAIINK